ncbi:MAG: pyridoxal phosphate-dependent aminotransferase [Tannerellaceae bacterium]|jgi:aspartate aminotransferase|nr:pyridoxal phosphate-dependent aminotransferase [Tannerellaceae bacterium]
MTQVSQLISQLSPSETLAMSQKSSELKARGVNVINLSVGEPDFKTPGHIKEAAVKAIRDNYSYYSPVNGYPALRQAIADKLHRDNCLTYSPDQIVVSNGAKQAICNALLSVIDPGDEVIIPAPYWVSYVEMVKLAGGVSVIVSTSLDNDYKMTPRQLSKAITPRTKALILCSPSNPTGCVYTRHELASLSAVLERHPNILILSDEIYEHISYLENHASLAQFEELRDRTIIINGVSKAYAMTGWRIGYMAAPQWIAKACSKLQGQYTSGPCSVSQQAALAALTGPQTCVQEMREAFRRRRDMMIQYCNEIKGLEVSIPQGAFYIFPECNAFFDKRAMSHTVTDSASLSMYLLERAHVATVGGAAFGEPNCIRISYAASDELLTEAMARIGGALSILV